MILDIAQYLDQICRSNKLIEHSDENTRFLPVGFGQALESNRSKLDTNHLCVIAIYLEKEYQFANLDQCKQLYWFNLAIVRNCEQGNFPQILQTLEDAAQFADQFLARMKQDMKTKVVCQIDFAQVKLLPIEKPPFDNVHGQILEVPFVKSSSFPYDSTQWNF